MCVSLFGGLLPACVHCLQKSEGVRLLGTGVIDSCEPHDVAAKDQT